MKNDRRTPDLVSRAEQRIRDALAASGSVSVSDLPPMWPLSRPLLRAVLGRMVDEGALTRAAGPGLGGPPRFVARGPGSGPAYARADR